MTKKNAIISAIFLLILFAVSLYFFIRTDNSAVTALSLFGVMTTGLLLIILSIFMLARLRVKKLTTKQEIILCNCVLIFMPLIPISYIVWAVLTGRGDILSKIVLSIMWILPTLGVTIHEKRRLKKRLAELSEST